MEQMLLSSPGGNSDWELEQKPSLGYLVLDTDKAASLPNGNQESAETGLDFRETGDELVSLSLDEILQENALNLGTIFRNSRYSNADHIMSWNERAECPVLLWDTHSSTPTQHEPANEPNLKVTADEQSDFGVSPLVQTVVGCLDSEKGNSSFLGEDLQDQVPVDLINIHSSPGEHLSLENAAPPVLDVLTWNEASDKSDFSILEDLSLEQASFSSPPCGALPSGVSPQGVSEEPPQLSHQEGCLSQVPQGGETSRETEDKGFFSEPASDPLTESNAILEGSCENHLSSPSHTCSPTAVTQALDVPEGSDLRVNGAGTAIGDGLSFECHAVPTCEEGCLRSGADDAQGNNPECSPACSSPLKPYSEGDSSPFGLQHQLTQPEAVVFGPDGDPTHLDDQPTGHGSAANVSVDLIKENVSLASTGQEGCEELISDLCLPSDAGHKMETPDPKPPESTLQDGLPGQESHTGSGEVKLDLNLVCRNGDCPEDLGSLSNDLSPGNIWMTTEGAEGLTLSDVGESSALPIGGNVTGGDDLSSLKAVFNALDQDGDGFVRIEEFVQFATAYGAEQVKDLTGFLDPSGLGVISFEDFHRGITAISNGSDPQLCEVGFNLGDEAGVPEFDDYVAYEQNEVTDSAYLGSESTYSECETFTDEDTGVMVHPELHEEVETDSAIDAVLHDPEETGSRLSLSSELNSHSLVTVIGGEEEHFEDFGESHTLDLLVESPDGPAGEESPASPMRCSSMLLSPRADPFPASFQNFLREEVVDFFCSQCHKQISRLEDISTRLNFLEMNSTSQRLSSKKVARHLLQSSALSIDCMEDLVRDVLELADTDITDKVMFLEKRVSELEQDSAANSEQHTRLRQENLQLVHRANALEEQLKEQEARAEETLQTELRRHKEALSKLERERGMELENLQSRLQVLDEENSELRSCVPCLRANIERLEEEKRKLQDSVEDMSERLGEEMESRRKMADKLTHERHKSQKEKECTQELIEDLRKQLEHLQLYKLEVEAKSGRSPSAGLQEYQNRTREVELEQEVRRLKQDNRSLKEQNDELNGQIINLSIQGAKNLFATSFSESLAAEISSVSRDELMDAIQKQEEINYRLQDYIDRIIVAIMESNPSILEVK